MRLTQCLHGARRTCFQVSAPNRVPAGSAGLDTFRVALGGVATIAIAGLWWTLFPALRKVDRFPQAPQEAQVVVDDDRAGGAAPLAGGAAST